MNNFCSIVVLQDSDSDIEELELLDPSPPNAVVGKISVSCSVEVRNMSNYACVCVFLLNLFTTTENNLRIMFVCTPYNMV